MTNNYQRGAQREREAARRLRQQGYTVVRSAGSHGPVDLVAWNGEETRLIQVKANRADALAAAKELKGMTWPPASRVEVWWGAGKTWQRRTVVNA